MDELRNRSNWMSRPIEQKKQIKFLAEQCRAFPWYKYKTCGGLHLGTKY